MTVIETFRHSQFAHCESGVMSAILGHHGLDMSEPMVFGISGALTFAYLPFLKFGNMPLISYRMFPGHIIKKLPKMIGMTYFKQTYRDQARAMSDLVAFIDKGRIVGIQTSAYFTTYFPPDMRFQFNAHNSLVIGKENGTYIVSDPIFETLQRIESEDLKKARFAKGLSAPKGLVHYPIDVPTSVDLEKLIRKGIKKTVNMMLHAPFPYIGLKGIRHLAKHIRKMPTKKDRKYVRHFLGNVVRMQEEIGTGGGGFRFIHAAFLQEAHAHLKWPKLLEASEKMTEAGDTWRTFALACAKAIKNKKGGDIDTSPIADRLNECADSEKTVYELLKKPDRD